MNRFIQKVKDLKLTYDIIITVLGIVLIVFLVLIFRNPKNNFFTLVAFVSAGGINILNGLKIVKDKKKRNMGVSYILFGIVIMFLGYLGIM